MYKHLYPTRFPGGIEELLRIVQMGFPASGADGLTRPVHAGFRSGGAAACWRHRVDRRPRRPEIGRVDLDGNHAIAMWLAAFTFAFRHEVREGQQRAGQAFDLTQEAVDHAVTEPQGFDEFGSG